MGFEPRRRVQFAGERWRCNLPSIPYPTSLPISQANSLARDCFSDISRALQGEQGHRPSMDATARAQGPHARGNRRHVRGGDAGMKRHRPMAPRTTVYLERRATGSLADLHLHLHAGPLPVGRSIRPSVRCDGRGWRSWRKAYRTIKPFYHTQDVHCTLSRWLPPAQGALDKGNAAILFARCVVFFGSAQRDSRTTDCT